MGAFQLPDDVLGDAAACLAYSFICLLVNCILVWLIWSHHERTSYVAFIAYFTLLATVSSLVQQFYDYIFWRNILTEQFYYGQQHAQDAEVQYQNGIYGLKLALSYVRIFCIIVEASLVFCFSLSLAATVYGWWAKNPRALRNMSTAGRVVPIALAVLSIVLLQTPFTHKSFTAYMVVANAQLILALFGSSVLLLMILYKYLQSRRQLKSWQLARYGKEASQSTTATTTSSTIKSRLSRAFSNSNPKPPGTSATFDNWLVLRLTIAFLTLSVFAWTNLAPRPNNRKTILENLSETEPDLSEKRAMSTVTGYLSGVSPSMLAFLVFGTTKPFQHKMYMAFVPTYLRERMPKSLRRIFNIRDKNGARPRYTGGHLPSNSTGLSRARSIPLMQAVASNHALTDTVTTATTPTATTTTPLAPRPPSAVVVPISQPPGGSQSTDRNTQKPRGRPSWIDNASSARSSTRLNEIGVAVTSPTFLREDDDDDDDDDDDMDPESGRGADPPFPKSPIPMSRFNSTTPYSSSNHNNSSSRRSSSTAGGRAIVHQPGGQHGRNHSMVNFATMAWSEDGASKPGSHGGSRSSRQGTFGPARQGSESGDLRVSSTGGGGGGGRLSSNSTSTGMFYIPSTRSGSENGGDARLGGGGPIVGNSGSRLYYGTPSRRGSESGDLRLGRGGAPSSNGTSASTGQVYNPSLSGSENGPDPRLGGGGGGPLGGSSSTRHYYGASPRRGSAGSDSQLGRGGPLGSNSSRAYYGHPRRVSEGSIVSLNGGGPQGRAPTTPSRYPL